MDVNSVLVEGKVNSTTTIILNVSGPKGSEIYLPVEISPEVGLKLRIVGRLRERSGEGLYVSAEYVEVVK